MRSNDRTLADLRPVTLTPNVSRYAEGSCLVEFGYTKVLCTASVEESVPPFKRNSGTGWVTAEYGLLPRSTGTRNPREAAKGKQTGRTQEIQRLIGRSFRSVCNLQALGERQITIDCDVLDADGGTRTAAITGGYVALHLACKALQQKGLIKQFPLMAQVSAISCGIVKGECMLDVDYNEDSNADVDANFVFDSTFRLIEIQGTAEKTPFTESQFIELMKLARAGAEQLFTLQRQALTSAA